MRNKRSIITLKEIQYLFKWGKKQVHKKESDLLKNYYLIRRTKDETRKNKSSKGIANTKNGKRSPSILKIH